MSAASPSMVLARNDDLPDWLSPSLVKELRQGLRSWIFVNVFLWVQVSMSILLVIETTVVTGGGNERLERLCEGSFWLNVGLVLCVLLPFRGLNSGVEDLKESCVDLQRLAGAEPGRLVTAKWKALGGLSFVVISSLLPFALLRYFLGGMEVVEELTLLLWLWAGALVLGAVAILLATLPMAGRAFVGGIVLVVLFPVVLAPPLQMLRNGGYPPGGLVSAMFWMPVAMVLVILTLGGAAMRLAGNVLDEPVNPTEEEFHKW